MSYLTVDEFHQRLGVRRINSHTLYKLIKAGKLPSVRLGGRILVPENALDLLFTQQAEERKRELSHEPVGVG